MGLLSRKDINVGREIEFSQEQSRWIIEGLLMRKNNFGDVRRKESKLIGRKVFTLIEGSNRYGCFLSIHVKEGRSPPDFLVSPAGNRGHNWGRIAGLIFTVVDKGYSTRNSPRTPVNLLF